MLPAMIITLSPFITSGITGVLKKLPLFTSLSDQSRRPIVRVLGALVALAYVIFGMWVTGSITPDILLNAVNVFILALLAWLGSLGVFHAFFQKIAPANIQ